MAHEHEHLTSIQKVLGSNPSWSQNFFCGLISLSSLTIEHALLSFSNYQPSRNGSLLPGTRYDLDAKQLSSLAVAQ